MKRKGGPCQRTIAELLQGGDGGERRHADLALLEALDGLGLLQELFIQLGLQWGQPARRRVGNTSHWISTHEIVSVGCEASQNDPTRGPASEPTRPGRASFASDVPAADDLLDLHGEILGEDVRCPSDQAPISRPPKGVKHRLEHRSADFPSPPGPHTAMSR